MRLFWSSKCVEIYPVQCCELSVAHFSAYTCKEAPCPVKIINKRIGTLRQKSYSSADGSLLAIERWPLTR